jgi:RimJ/RimL family protein N-acetyltransferase
MQQLFMRFDADRTWRTGCNIIIQEAKSQRLQQTEEKSTLTLEYYSYPKITHKNISETEAMISKKKFATPDASGALRRSFFFAITLSDDPLQKVIGGAGINALFPAPSVGYSIHPDFWSNGYATEAVAGVIDAWWSLERKTFDEDMAELSPEKLFAACNKANIGSMKVLQKTGFALYHEFTVGDETVALLELERCAR